MSASTPSSTPSSTHVDQPAGSRRVQIPSYRVLFGTVVVVCMLGMWGNLALAIATGQPPDRPRTHQEQIVGVLSFGTIGLVVCLTIGLWAARTPHRSRVGAIVFGALAVPCLVFFFSGLPAMLGATAAHLAGLTSGRTPVPGLPRVFGTVGLAIALLNLIVVVVGISVAWLVG